MDKDGEQKRLVRISYIDFQSWTYYCNSDISVMKVLVMSRVNTFVIYHNITFLHCRIIQP